MLSKTFAKRFEELHAKAGSFSYQKNEGFSGTYVPRSEWQKWGTSVQNLILAVFGEDSPHYENFTEELKSCGGYDYDINSLKGIFESAKEDFEGGYVFNVDLRVSGEVFGDLIILAKQSLAEGHKDVAAVLASAALEDTLKRYTSMKEQ